VSREPEPQPVRIKVGAGKVVHSQPETPATPADETPPAEPESETPAEPESVPPAAPESEPPVTADTQKPVEVEEAPAETAPPPPPPAPEESAPPAPPVPPEQPEQPEKPVDIDQQDQASQPEQPAQPESGEVEDVVPVLLDVSFEKSINESETVLFRLNHFYPPLVFGIEKGEPRVVCDFFDAEIDENIPPEIEAGGEFVDRILVTNESDPDKVRVELVLMPNRNYDLQQLFFKEENLFVVIIKELQEDSAAAN
jgi:hypothetical protein